MDIEFICRLVCQKKGIDPDATGTAITKETRERLGDTYPLWRYQETFVRLVLENGLTEPPLV